MRVVYALVGAVVLFIFFIPALTLLSIPFSMIGIDLANLIPYGIAYEQPVLFFGGFLAAGWLITGKLIRR